jgi:DNA repair and recombination RAD54-like protein
MVDFCNPGVLGTPAEFRKKYERPILNGREPMATDKEREKSMERSADLSAFVNGFILRRTNDLLSKHLPPKVIELVCCRMTPIQYQLYEQYVQSRAVTNLLLDGKKKGGQTALSAITTIRKLMNHPRLIYDMVKSNKTGKTGFESCMEILSPANFEAPRGVRAMGGPAGWEQMSGKFGLVARMLELLRKNTKDRVVLVSNFTQTLDLFTTLCREKRYPCIRLDGSISLSKREKMVKNFNDPNCDQFVFLLSSKAGGCGLNLIGGNRLILFDMSWNPAGGY